MLRRGMGLVVLPRHGCAGLVSQFGVTAAIERLRPLAFGASPDAAALASFGSLHRASVVIFGAVGLAALLLAWLHARAEVGSRQTS
jgi:hypothetical protein